MTDTPRLIEVAFPLKQTSLDSVHEKNVRHGHISTLHIWPARRPLAACRAALIATLLPDPGNKEERDKILEKLGGKVVEVVKKKKLPSGKIEEKVTEETVGGILHWGRESNPDLDWFREKIREAYGEKAPKVLDPFSGGGAIPLEAMRLGCEATAIDINPVAWFILKCTLEYPQKLANQKLPLPNFVLANKEFMESYFKAQGLKGASLKRKLEKLGLDKDENKLAGWDEAAAYVESFGGIEADLAWHVRAWGWWVLQEAKADLERFYPVVDGKPTVAYLWARTVKCKNCRATVPLLKTRWLCKKDKKRVVLTMESNADKSGVVFGVQNDVPQVGGNSAQKREHDKRISAGTMSKSGATCPCCGSIMTMDDIRLEGKAGRLGAVMTAVVVDGKNGKEYRLPIAEEIQMAAEAEEELEGVYAEIPFGLPEESIIEDAKRNTWCVQYGVNQFYKLFTSRQLLALGTFAKNMRFASKEIQKYSYFSSDFLEAIIAYLATMFDRLANQSSMVARWNKGGENIEGTFARFALPILWYFAEVNPLAETSGGYPSAFEWVTLAISHLTATAENKPNPLTINQSAITTIPSNIDIIITDPPYYNALGYSVLMDFFYVWLRRILKGVYPDTDKAFDEPLSPKWNTDSNDGELVDDASRFSDDRQKSKAVYEEGMFRVFQNCHKALKPEGRLVIVFAHKHPDAWETLVSAIIRAGFIVDGSWPIQTERQARTRSLSSAALSSSVWLVCKKRPITARPGWDNRVLEDMRDKLQGKWDEELKKWTSSPKLREFWDAGIRGPDFVWAATGPAMEAYSKHPVVKKANEPGQLLTVSDFLKQVRRMVLDFVVGRVLSETTGREEVSSLDDITTYYLLHRHDFGMEDAPIGACILYAVSCGLSDNALADQFDILIRTGGKTKAEDDDEEDEETPEDADAEIEQGTGSKVKLKPWQQRKRKNMGYEAAGGRPIPLIDQVHRLMHLWKAGDVVKVDEYLDDKGLRRNALFHQLLQALIELATAGSDERALLESISNHIAARGKESNAIQLGLFNTNNGNI
jgi:adenine-specific DNA methylase